MERPIALVLAANPAIRAALDRRSFATIETADVDEALATIERRVVRVVVIDGSLSPDRLDPLLQCALGLTPPALIVSFEPTDPGRALQLVQRGVFDLLPLSPSIERIEIAAERVRRQLELLDDLRARLDGAGDDDPLIVGHSPEVSRLNDELERLADRNDPVWFHGEPGSGRHGAARLLHTRSDRRAGPFVRMDCVALARGSRDSFWSSEHGGAPGARGPLEQARGGTLFLEGVTGLSLESQDALDRALERQSRGGARIVVSSEHSAAQAVARGTLLESLAERLDATIVTVPPLRSRAQDVAPLARRFAARICALNQMSGIAFAPDAIAALERHHWPGNVRELREAVEHAAILAIDGTIRSNDLPESVRGGTAERATGHRPTPPLSSREFRDAKREVVDSFEEAYLRELLERHSGNVTAASQQAGMLRSALQRLLRKHGLRSAEFRSSRAQARSSEEASPGAESSS